MGGRGGLPGNLPPFLVKGARAGLLRWVHFLLIQAVNMRVGMDLRHGDKGLGARGGLRSVLCVLYGCSCAFWLHPFVNDLLSWCTPLVYTPLLSR